ncbi:MAG TPA: cupin domain-containing protein [Candidatus Dormibacteraeota bacterium]|nr:cupin domain-containing protein [Candidatus Dormibacteraeota bacterium]
MRTYARVLRLVLITLSIAGLLVALNAVPGAATPASGVTGTTLARGTNQSPGTIPIKQGMDVVVATNTFAPGGSSGWHSHPGGAIVVVVSGQLTDYNSIGGHCVATTYTAGQAFIERPGVLQLAVNNGTTDTVVYVTFPSVPDGAPSRTDEAAPADCP